MRAPQVNELLSALISSEAGTRAAAAVNDFVRSQMYHQYTKMPKRGVLRRILPPASLKSLDEWERLGVPASELREAAAAPGPPDEAGESNLFGWEYETGELFYEMREGQLAREDYERRLKARTVPRWEWRTREHFRRSQARQGRAGGRRTPTESQVLARAYAVFGRLAAQIRAAHARD